MIRLMEGTKSEEHGIIRNSVNDNVNKQLYQFYRFVISLEETNNKAIAGSSSFSFQQLIFQCEKPLKRLTYLYNILFCGINLRGGALASSIANFVCVFVSSNSSQIMATPIIANLLWLS